MSPSPNLLPFFQMFVGANFLSLPQSFAFLLAISSSLNSIYLSAPCYYCQQWWFVPFLSSFSTQVQGSFEHLHVLLPANYKWVNRGSNNLCVKKKNSSRALLLVLLLLASLIFVNLKCFKFHCVPSFPPIALVLRFW